MGPWLTSVVTVVIASLQFRYSFVIVLYSFVIVSLQFRYSSLQFRYSYVIVSLQFFIVSLQFVIVSIKFVIVSLQSPYHLPVVVVKLVIAVLIVVVLSFVISCQRQLHIVWTVVVLSFVTSSLVNYRSGVRQQLIRLVVIVVGLSRTKEVFFRCCYRSLFSCQ